MPGKFLHEKVELKCVHGSGTLSRQTDQRVTVSGQKLLVKPTCCTISDCKNPPPNAGTGPCTSALWANATTRVKANGQPVLLENSQATCVPMGMAFIGPTQSRVKGT